MPDQIAVLFCCMGNICRSTMAEGVFRAMTKAEPYKSRISRVDSCGTIGYHTGDPPDERTMATLAAHGITDYTHRARQIELADFSRFDYIFAMDGQNLRDLEKHKARAGPGSKARVLLFGTYAGTGAARPEIVADPYYGGRDGFATTYEQTTRFTKNFLKAVFPDIESSA